MKIALVTETYPPEVNGVAMSLSQLVVGLKKRNHSVQVVRPKQKSESGRIGKKGEEWIVRGAPIPRYPGLRFGLPCKRRLIKAWQEQKPDIVHVATEGPLGLSAINAAKSLGIPCSSSFHTNFHSYSEHYNAAFMNSTVLSYLRWIHNKTVCNMAPTDELRDELTDAGFTNMATLGRGTRTELFNPSARDERLRKEWGADENTTVIVHVSRLAAEKNYDLLFETYRKIRDIHFDCAFVVVGDGPERKKWEKRFPQAHFTGMVSLEDRESLARIYASADLFLYPSLTETYGNVIIEAMACGNAVLSFDYAAARLHIQNGVNGVVVPTGDREAFIEAGSQLAQNKQRQEYLGTAAADYAAENCDWTPIIDSFENLLDFHAFGQSSRGMKSAYPINGYARS